MDIKKLSDNDLNFHIRNIADFLGNPLFVSLIELDPTNELLLQAKSLNYRLRQEKAFRSADELVDSFNKKFGRITFEKLTPDELSVIIPEWPADPETGDIAFQTGDDAEADAEADAEDEEKQVEDKESIDEREEV